MIQISEPKKHTGAILRTLYTHQYAAKRPWVTYAFIASHVGQITRTYLPILLTELEKAKVVIRFEVRRKLVYKLVSSLGERVACKRGVEAYQEALRREQEINYTLEELEAFESVQTSFVQKRVSKKSVFEEGVASLLREKGYVESEEDQNGGMEKEFPGYKRPRFNFSNDDRGNDE